MPIVRWGCFLALSLCFLAACGGDDDETPAGGDDDATAVSSGGDDDTPEDAGNGAGQPAGSAGEGDDIDVCALLTPEDVEAALGVAAPEPEPEDPFPPFYGCRWEAETPVLTVSVIAWDNDDDARESMELERDNNDFPALEGLGDEAHVSQPIDDVTARRGRFEVSVGLYFVSEDDEEELDRAIEVARLVLERLQ